MIAWHFGAMFPTKINADYEDLLGLQLLLRQQLKVFRHKGCFGITS